MDIGGVAGGLLVVAFGLAGTLLGRSAWRGRELGWVSQALADPTQRGKLVLGGTTLYRTWYGSSYVAAWGSPGFVLIGAGYVARSLTGGDDDPWWWALSIVGASLVVSAALFALVYQWVGVPDALRPAAQRGQPPPGGVGRTGLPHPLDRLLATPGPVDLGPDPTRPWWARGDPDWVAPPERHPRRGRDAWRADPWSEDEVW